MKQFRFRTISLLAMIMISILTFSCSNNSTTVAVPGDSVNVVTDTNTTHQLKYDSTIKDTIAFLQTIDNRNTDQNGNVLPTSYYMNYTLFKFLFNKGGYKAVNDQYFKFQRTFDLYSAKYNNSTTLTTPTRWLWRPNDPQTIDVNVTSKAPIYTYPPNTNTAITNK